MFAVEGLEDRIRSILVVRMSAIGDIILTLPVVDELARRFPAATIDFVVKHEYAELLRHHSSLTKVWEFDRATGLHGLKKLTGEISSVRYDLLIDLHRNLRSAHIRWLGNAYMTRSYAKHTTARLLLKYLRVNLMQGAPRVCDRYFSALEDFGITRGDTVPVLNLGRDDLERADEAMKNGGVGAGQEYIAIAPGASFPTKRWSPRRFAKAAGELTQGTKKVALLGDMNDRAAADDFREELGRQGVEAIDLAGKLSLLESAAVIKGASLVLTNDSGLMHIAGALARPLVAVFGPTSRELGFYPLGERVRVVELEGLGCRPCTLHGGLECPEGHHRCMEDIGVDRVVEAAKGVL